MEMKLTYNVFLGLRIRYFWCLCDFRMNRFNATQRLTLFSVADVMFALMMWHHYESHSVTVRKRLQQLVTRSCLRFVTSKGINILIWSFQEMGICYSIIWLLILIFIGYFIGGIAGFFYILFLPFTVCIEDCAVSIFMFLISFCLKYVLYSSSLHKRQHPLAHDRDFTKRLVSIVSSRFTL